MKKVLTFGELMLRLMPQDGHRFLQNGSFEATFGGGEANVAVSLANFGCDAAFVTALPDNPIGKAAINALRYFGVDTSLIRLQGDRMGVYYVEKGQSQRPSKVVYDRKHSSIAESKASDYDWDSIFEGVGWFHFTGITPALSPDLPAICLTACKKAQEKGIVVSCDLNYRKNLWTTDQAYETMSEIMKFVNVCIANEEDADKVLRIKAKGTNVESGELSHESYKDVASQIKEQFGCDKVAITLRSSISANDNGWAGMYYDGTDYYYSPEYNIRLWDRVGGGDSFGGGLIYASINGYAPQDIINFAVAASCLKQTIQGDFNRSTVAEVTALMEGDSSGRVQR